MLLRAVTAIVSACALAAGCASTTTSSALRPGSVAPGVEYALPEAAYEVTLDASRRDIALSIRGPLIVASDARYALNTEPSEFSSVRYYFDVNPNTSLAQRLAVTSDGRADQIALRLGQALGTVGGAATNLPGAGETLQSKPEDGQALERAIVYQRLWRFGDWTQQNDSLNSVISQWFNHYCAPAGDCEMSTAPRVQFSLAGASAWGIAATTPGNEECTSHVCISRTRRAQVTLGITPGDANASLTRAQAATFDTAPPRGIARTLNFEVNAPNPRETGYLDLDFGSLGDGASIVTFSEGRPTYFARGQGSSVESGVLMPINFVAGALNTFVRVLPVRLVIDIQRHQAEAIRDGSSTTLQRESQDLTTGSDQAVTLDGAPKLPDGSEISETTPSSTNTIVLVRRATAAEPRSVPDAPARSGDAGPLTPPTK